ncbi:hypothetical protein ScPMuIL_002666 [Solemya velum]
MAGRRQPKVILPIIISTWVLALADGATGSRQSFSNPRITKHPEDRYVAKNMPDTLYCAAEGDPTPVITWYRDGQKVITDNENPKSHRMLLQNGDLFFLRVIHNKNNKPDVGVYYCNATNIHGSAISRNATLQIAVLRDTFSEMPEDTTVGVGDTATLTCVPPRGEPDPKVIWRKDGIVVQTDNRVVIRDDTDLVISASQKSDGGEYVCWAINKAGERESSPATLMVLEKPIFRETPEHKSINEGDTVEFRCEVTGDEPLQVRWEKEDGQIRYGRARMLPDRTLRIENVEVGDEGQYICIAENVVGTAEAVARLTVQSHPSFLIKPKDQVVGLGRTVTLQCVVKGNPPPTVFWKKGKEQTLMFPNQEKGRLSVAGDGTFRIERVRFEDAGEYMCQALNAIGNAETSARIDVREHDPRPPPIIRIGPQNQTLPTKSLALLLCEAVGTPHPSVRWYKDGRALPMADTRITQLSTGTLQISDLKIPDSGTYTCKATSETGETTWSATLIADEPSHKPDIPFHRMPDRSAFPDEPSKPIVTDVNDTSVHLTWKPNRNTGGSPVFAYIIEYFSHKTPNGWVIATESVEKESYTVVGLKPNTPYIFVIRAKNSHGIGAPSPPSDVVDTPGRYSGVDKPIVLPRDQIKEILSGMVVEMVKGEAINSSAIRVNWRVLKAKNIIDSYHVKYKHILDLRHLTYGKTLTKVVDHRSLWNTLTELGSYDWYEICVMAYSQGVSAPCSSPLKVQTQQGVPSAPPQNIVIRKDSDTTVHIKWTPPPKQQQNGEIVGYQVKCISNDSRHNCSLATNSTTDNVMIHRLSAGMTYSIQLAGRTSEGVGVWSKQFLIGPEQPNIMKEPWFIGMLIGTVGGTLWLALCIFSIWLCRKRKNKKKMAQNGMYNVPVHKTDTARNGNMFCRPPYELHKDGTLRVNTGMGGLSPEVTNLLDQNKDLEMKDQNIYNTAMNDIPQMKTFYQKPHPVAPYATTALINTNNINRPIQGMEHLFRPIHQCSGSGDSCQKNDILSSDSNTDNSRPNTGIPHDHNDNMASPTSDSGSHTTDENGLLIKHGKKTHKQIGPPKQAMVNWAELLPPPPEHPPPSDIGTPPDSPRNSLRYSDRTMNRNVINNSPCSPISKISACSCPVPHNQTPVSGWNMPAYSDSDYHRCQSPKYYDTRPYSPQQQYSEIRTHSPRQDTWGPLPRTIGCVHGARPMPADYRTCPNRTYHSDQEKIMPMGPALQGYKIRTPQESEYQFLSDTERGPTPPVRLCAAPGMQGVPDGHCMDRACQSSLPSLASECVHSPVYAARLEMNPNSPHLHLGVDGYTRNADSPLSEVGPDYAGESDMEPSQHHGNMANVRPGDPNVPGSMMVSWASVTDQSNTDGSSLRSSAASSSDGSFLTEADFASAVAKAAELSGLTVVGTTVCDPNKPGKRHRRQRAPRPTSPYSTDSNFSAVVHKPYPKSQRKKQMKEQGRCQGRDPSQMFMPCEAADFPSYNRPNFPSTTNYPISPSGTTGSRSSNSQYRDNREQGDNSKQ